jgi:hypothetical protein
MAYYRLYFVQRGHFVRFEEIEAEDDEAAIALAGRRVGPLSLELWCGRRRVTSFEVATAVRN